MLSFSHLILADGVPIYQQILRYVKLGIAGGTIAHGRNSPPGGLCRPCWG